jgi:hypothetical protein
MIEQMSPFGRYTNTRQKDLNAFRFNDTRVIRSFVSGAARESGQ